MNIIDASPENPTRDYETFRERYGPHERRVRAVELLYWLGAIFNLSILLLILSLPLDTDAPEAGYLAVTIGVGVFFAFMIALPAISAWHLRHLSRTGQVLGAFCACGVLLAFPVGTLVGGLVLWTLLGKDGKVVFSDYYREAVRATPDLQFGASRVVVGLTIAFVVLAVGGAFAAIWFPPEFLAADLENFRAAAPASVEQPAVAAPTPRPPGETAALASEPANPTAKVIRFASSSPGAPTSADLVEDWSEDLKEQTNARLELHHDPKIGQHDPLEVLQKIHEGTLDAGVVSSFGLDVIARPALLALSASGVADAEQFDELVQSLESPLQEAVERAGFVVLAWQWSGARRVFSSKAIRRPSEFKGRRPWLPDRDPAFEFYFEALGVVPVGALEPTGVHEALAEDKIDTLIATSTEVASSQWDRELSHVSKQSFGPSVSAILIGTETFQALSTDDQRALIDSARRASEQLQQRSIDAEAEAYRGLVQHLEEVDLAPHQKKWNAVAHEAHRLMADAQSRAGRAGHPQQLDRVPLTAESIVPRKQDLSEESALALEWFKDATNITSPMGQFNLGLMYELGLGFPQNFPKAAERYRSSAERGFALAQHSLGVLYEEGRGVPKDAKEAVRWYRKASEQGLPRAQLRLAAAFTNGTGVPKDQRKAASWCRKAAGQGLAPAEHNLAVMYLEGQGVPQDREKALEWHRKAADQGFAPSQYNLAVYYEDGVIVEQDLSAAVDWYRKAAEQGFVPAQYNLASMYEDGRGVPQDDEEAARWFTDAAQRGFAMAQHNLGVLYEEGRGVSQDETEAVNWYRKAADQGFADAQNNLGRCYADGRGVVQDERKAFEWYEKAVEQGNSESQYNLGRAFAKGLGVPEDLAKAVELFGLAAQQGLADAQLALGREYAVGIGVPADRAKAEQWYSAAARQGKAEAIVALRELYNLSRTGEVVTKR